MSADPKLQRIWDAYTLGGRAVRHTDPSWRKALLEATAIAETADAWRHDPTSGASVKLRSKVISGLEVAVPYHLILGLETTWAELDYQANELQTLASEIRDVALRAKLEQTLNELKLEIERKKRQHLKVVP